MVGIVVVVGRLIGSSTSAHIRTNASEEQKQILRAAYPTDDESSVGPQACGAQDDTFLKEAGN